MNALLLAAALACLALAVRPAGARHRTLGRARHLLAPAASHPEAVGSRPVRLWGSAVPEWQPAPSMLRGRVTRLLRRAVRPEVGCVLVGAAVAVLGGSPLPLLLGAAGWPLVRRTARAGAARRAQDRRTEAVIGLCGVLAGEVRAGRQPGQALLAAGRERADGLAGARAEVLAAARFGGDVPAVLGRAAGEPGAEGLAGIGACWRVAVDRGAGLAAGLDRLEAALRAERDQRAELRAQLAGARSTALLLAALPVLGLALGSALGADPLRVLLHSAAGLGCLAVGGALEALGLWWALRIVRKGETG
ncbi:type II secretion system F family protein [Streptomyces sp. NPDC058045]|uniref:type II secretion system F family protein n=1 Tax=Streptomyces sp. NPDC058045 TaxID=3346311 RepID=UPI0036EE9EAA